MVFGPQTGRKPASGRTEKWSRVLRTLACAGEARMLVHAGTTLIVSALRTQFYALDAALDRTSLHYNTCEQTDRYLSTTW